MDESLADLAVRTRCATSRPGQLARALAGGRVIKAFRDAVREALRGGPLTVAELGGALTGRRAYRHLKPTRAGAVSRMSTTLAPAIVAYLRTYGPATADHVDTDCIASCSSPTPHSFTDVPANSFANTAISWLVEANITQGVTPTEFRPNNKVTRGQMAAFLWRAAGSPAPAQAHSFTDVPADAYYNTAVSWLVGENITTGTGNGRFSPNNQVTRGQTASLLHRAAGSPAAVTHHAFTDVAPTAYYDGAVSWLVEAGITSGVSEDRFAPNGIVTRAQMAVFLYRSACGADS